MICPKWVFTRIQPIAIRNVLDYLVAALDCAASTGRILEIGGQDVLTYADMMTGYARARGLKRRLLAVPGVDAGLSSYWVHLVTPYSRQHRPTPDQRSGQRSHCARCGGTQAFPGDSSCPTYATAVGWRWKNETHATWRRLGVMR